MSLYSDYLTVRNFTKSLKTPIFSIMKYITDPRIIIGVSKILEDELSEPIVNNIITEFIATIGNKDLRLADNTYAIEVLIYDKSENKYVAAIDYFMNVRGNQSKPLNHLYDIVQKRRHIIYELYMSDDEKKKVSEFFNTQLLRLITFTLALLYAILHKLFSILMDTLILIRSEITLQHNIFSFLYEILNEVCKKGTMQKRGKIKFMIENLYTRAAEKLTPLERVVITAYLMLFYRILLMEYYDPLLAKLDKESIIKIPIFYLKHTNQVLMMTRQALTTCMLLMKGLSIPIRKNSIYESLGEILHYIYHHGVKVFIDAYKLGYISQKSLEDLRVLLLELSEILFRLLHLSDINNTAYLVTPARILKVLLESDDYIKLVDLAEKIIALVKNEDQEIVPNVLYQDISAETIAKSISMNVSLGVLKEVLGDNIQGYKVQGLNITPPKFHRIIGAIYLTKST